MIFFEGKFGLFYFGYDKLVDVSKTVSQSLVCMCVCGSVENIHWNPPSLNKIKFVFFPLFQRPKENLYEWIRIHSVQKKVQRHSFIFFSVKIDCS